MFERSVGTYCILLNDTLVNFSVSNGVYSELGSYTITSTYIGNVALLKMSNFRCVALMTGEFVGEENQIVAYVFDYSSSVPTLISEHILDNVGNIYLHDELDYTYTAGSTSFGLKYWDKDAGNIAYVEISLGETTI